MEDLKLARSALNKEIRRGREMRATYWGQRSMKPEEIFKSECSFLT